MIRRVWPDVAAALVLLAPLALVFFPVTLGDRTLFPSENIYQWEPWRSMARQVGVPPPHNTLLSDLTLQTLPWKQFIVDAVRSGQFPLWNPYTFAGQPFLAAGQHSALYPPAWLFLVMPVERAIGWYTLLNLWLAGGLLYLFLRSCQVGRFGATVGGLAFELAGPLQVSVVFPMIIGAVVWAPGVLACVERMVASDGRAPPGWRGALPWAMAGAVAIGLSCLAGHPEITGYLLMASGLYAVVRLALSARGWRQWRPVRVVGANLAAMYVVGLLIGAVQLAPMAEYLRANYRQFAGDYGEVVSYAFPPWHALAFLLPDVFGNPTHHSYYDVFDRVERNLPPDPSGERLGFVWARAERSKNYIEGAAYVGILPLVLAALAIWLRPLPQTVALGALGAIALLFAFGSPLYALVYYLAPGWQQVRTPFRWVFVYAIVVCALAGIGAHALDQARRDLRASRSRRIGKIGWIVAGIGAVGLGLCVAAALAAPITLRVAEAVMRRIQMFANGFANPSFFASYELRNLAWLGLVTLLTGIAVLVAWRWRERWYWRPVAVAVVALDLVTVFGGFNARSDPSWLRVEPPMATLLQAETGLHRVSVFRGDKPLNPNLPWLLRLPDIRGYDSVVIQQHVEFMGLIEHQGALGFNRISDFYERPSLNSPLIDLIGVKHIVTPETIDDQRWSRVFGETLKVYRNERVMPRAYVAFDAVVEPDHARSDDIMRRADFDPRQLVILDRAPPDGLARLDRRGMQPADITRYRFNDVTIEVTLDAPGVLVLTDTYFPGWTARIDGETVEIARAYGAFRAVVVPAGSHRIEFRYLPLSFVAGALLTALGLAFVVLAGLALGWRRLYRDDESALARRVLKNSATPMAANLYVKVIDLVFAFVVFRILGPAGVGAYSFAVAVFGYQETLNTWGLGTYTIHQVARDPARANRLLGQIACLRLGLWCLVTPLIFVVLFVWHAVRPLEPGILWAVALLSLALAPSNIAATVSAVFQAREQMEAPAGIQVVTASLRIVLGLAALALGWGYVGLAGVALCCATFNAGAFLWLMRRSGLWPEFALSGREAWSILSESRALMINDFLHRAFFRFDVILLTMLTNSTIVGYYATAYKFIDGLNLIPSTFTFAIFPLLSRLAGKATDAFDRAYRLALKYMLLISLPIAVGATIVAHDIIRLIAGEQFLPHAGYALQILIWFLPFSFVNGVTQYVLIAVNEARAVTRGFLIAAPFNIGLNLALIPTFTYLAASGLTVASEWVLLAPFLLALRGKTRLPNPLELTWRPVASSVAMGGLTWFLYASGAPLAFNIVVSGLAYAAGLLALGAVDATDRAVLAQLGVRFGQRGGASAAPVAPGDR